MGTVAIFGATGLTGSKLVEIALDRGHQVRAHVRDPARLTVDSSRVTCIEGDVLDLESVQEAVVGVDAVFSALNVARSSNTPWATLLPPEDIVSQGVRNMVTAMQSASVTRILTVSAHGVGDSLERCGRLYQWFIKHSMLEGIMSDHLLAELAMADAGLEWTAVRPLVLTNGARRDTVRVVAESLGTLDVISRADVAGFMLDAWESSAFVGEAPSIVGR